VLALPTNLPEVIFLDIYGLHHLEKEFNFPFTTKNAFAIVISLENINIGWNNKMTLP
jgi:hypothetical protein